MEVWISSAIKYDKANGCNLFIEVGCASSTYLPGIYLPGTRYQVSINRRTTTCYSGKNEQQTLPRVLFFGLNASVNSGTATAPPAALALRCPY